MERVIERGEGQRENRSERVRYADKAARCDDDKDEREAVGSEKL